VPAVSSPEDRLAVWTRFFEKEVPPEIVHDVVAELIENGKHEDAIVCLEQAILHGQIQPWMYQVLAETMQATGRPKAQIERVLLSSQDVILNDPRSMMHLAAYLVRFERFERAIELYRQAAALDPSRPEPFVLALELATRTKNYNAIAWSAPEVLTFSWVKGREQLNRLAEESAASAESALIKGGDFARAFELRTEMQKARRLDLVVRLEWSGQGDLDLQIREPGGTICSAAQTLTSAGGIFVHDGFGPIQDHCYEEYLCPQGLPGEYSAVVKHVSGDIVGKRARITITRDRGTPNEESFSETIFIGPTDQMMRFSLSRGRRVQANLDRRNVELKLGKNPAIRNSVLAQLGAGVGVGQIAQRSGAVGYTPVITEIAEGVRLSALATVSGDRRYVRINANPVFSAITDVFSFTVNP
jgi:tetratricopeptide (TPR) repeat protein